MTFAYRKLDLLLDAFAQLREQLPNAQLVLVGGRPAEIAQLRAQAAALQIDAAVTWAGQLPQEQITPYLQAADALVIPDTVTDVTASPLKLFEYLAAGRAVVLPDIPALAEVLPPAIGYYFRRGDAGALAHALAAALTDPQPARARARRPESPSRRTPTPRAPSASWRWPKRWREDMVVLVLSCPCRRQVATR